MTLQVKVKFSGVHYFAINDGASWTISAVVSVFAARREESDVVALPDDDDRDRGVDI